MNIYALYVNNVSVAVDMDWLPPTNEYFMRISENDVTVYSSTDQPIEKRTYEEYMTVLNNRRIRLPSLWLRAWKDMGCKDCMPVVTS